MKSRVSRLVKELDMVMGVGWELTPLYYVYVHFRRVRFVTHNP